jgi:hypothetical protein
VGAVDLDARKPALACDRGDPGEAPDEVEDLLLRERARLRIVAEDLQLHGGRPERLARDVARRLPSRMRDLHPQLVACRRAGPRPGREPPPRLARRRLGIGHVDCDVARPLQHAPVDLYVAGDQQAGAALAPQAVEPLVPRRRAKCLVGKPLGHGRLA